ncbi:MAG: pyrroline-5-carboxylate reductase [Elusimicrobia bacterium]|nr:pyrroline-5-carboxylate reductase [Candidatus Liberimonas magnetica]
MPQNRINKKIAFLGAGNMAEALINGFVGSGLVLPKNITASDINKKRLTYIKKQFGVKTENNIRAVKTSEIIFIAVKPKDAGVLLGEIGRYLNKDKLMISIAAGITTKYIEGFIDKNVPVIRAMPNTPALVGKGAIAVAGGKYANRGDIDVAVKLFSSAGIAVKLNEKKLDAVTAVSGSGPAYVFYLSEAMEKAAVKLGLSSDIAKKLVHQTVLGAGKMLTSLSLDASVLRKNVTSPGGTTEAAINILEKRQFTQTVIEAIKQADKKAKELRKD